MAPLPSSTRRAVAVLPTAIAAAVFLPAIIGAGWVADDAVNLAVHANQGDLLGEWTTPTYAHAGSGKGHIWRPIPATLQHIVALVSGRSASAFRLLNVLLHLGNVALLQTLARRRGASPLSAGLLAMVFAVHPVTADAVCWSSDVYDLVATTAILAVLGVATSGLPLQARMAWIAGMTLVAGLCKESAIAVVPVVGIVGIMSDGGWREGRKNGLALGAASAVGAAVYLASHGTITAQSYAGAAGATPLIHKIQAGLSAAGWLVPRPMTQAPMAHLFDPTDWAGPAIGLLTLVGAAVVAVWAGRRNPRIRWRIGGALAAWCLLLAPAAIGIPLIGVQAVRYAYLPLAATLFLASGMAHRPPGRTGLLLGIGLSLLGLVHTMPRTHDFRDDGSLWSAELRAEPTNPYAAGSLARWLLKTGDAPAALALWTQAVDAAPPGLKVFDRDHERWLLAQAAFLRGRPDLALSQVDAYMASLVQQDRPVPGNAWCLKADSLDRLGDSEAAAHAAARCSP